MSATNMMSESLNLSQLNDNEIKVLTKPIATYNNTLIDQNELKQRINLSRPQTWTAPKSHNGFLDVGELGMLPMEVIHSIFAETDIQSLMRLRATNSGVKFLVEDWSPFRAAMTDAQPAVAALLATKAARLWTFVDLEDIIYKTKCYYCREHAEVLHLLKMQRVCFRCVTVDRRLLAVTSSYALSDMGLTEAELERIPQLVSIRQRSFWGTPSESSVILDYAVALEVAMEKEYPSQRSTTSLPLHEAVNVTLARTGEELEEGYFQRRMARRPTPLYLRRAQQSKHLLSKLPGALLNPPESSNVQHACCVHLPVLTRATASSPAYPVRALLCAGCSFYFNYHSSLPHQCHTMYPHPLDSRVQGPSSPLLDHLASCPYARFFYSTHIRPRHLTPYADNPLLLSNGGRWTPAQLRSKLDNHLLTLLAPSTAQHRHFVRHVLDTDGTSRLSLAYNNEAFEMLPWEVVERAEAPRPVVGRTGLDVEIGEKMAQEDASVTLSLLQEHELDVWTRKRLDELRRRNLKRKADEKPEVQGDFGDLIADQAMSQASWATARAGSATCLFRGWMGLFVERKRKTEVAEAKARGKRSMRSLEIGRWGWGLDRFGCVSDLG